MQLLLLLESWIDIAKLMKATDSEVFSIHLGLMHYMTIDYTNQNSFQNREIKFDVFLMGVSLNIASLQDTKNKVDFSVAYQNLLSDVEAFDYVSEQSLIQLTHFRPTFHLYTP